MSRNHDVNIIYQLNLTIYIHIFTKMEPVVVQPKEKTRKSQEPVCTPCKLKGGAKMLIVVNGLTGAVSHCYYHQ